MLNNISFKYIDLSISNLYVGYDKYKEYFIRDNEYFKSYDFTLKYEKLIIEYNNVFWHPNPLICWENWENTLIKTDKETLYKNEQIKLNIAKKHGFKVLVIWNTDTIDYNINACINFIKNNTLI